MDDTGSPRPTSTRNATLAARVRRIYHGWWVAIGGMVALALLIGSQTGGTMGLFFVALLREFGWSRTLISGAFSFVRVEGSILGPLEGYLTDKIGSHRMVLMGSIIAGGGFFILSAVSHPVHFYVALMAITAGAGLGGFIPVVTAVNWWFSRRRNRATGLAMAGVAAGALWSPIIAWGITAYGWRATSVAIGIALIVVCLPTSRLLQRPKGGTTEDGAQAPSGARAHGAAEDSGQGPDFTLKQAMRTGAFWLIPLAHATNGFSTTAVYVHGIPRLSDAGFSLQTAGFIMAAYGAMEVAIRVFGSFIGDRVDKRIGIAVFCTVQALGVVVLAFASTLPMAFLFAVLFAVGHGGRGPLIVAIRGDYFGRRNFGVIMGIGSLITSIAGVATPLLLGILFDVQGTYLLGFLAMALLTFLGGFLVLFARRPMLPGTEAPRPAAA